MWSCPGSHQSHSGHRRPCDSGCTSAVGGMGRSTAPRPASSSSWAFSPQPLLLQQGKPGELRLVLASLGQPWSSRPHSRLLSFLPAWETSYLGAEAERPSPAEKPEEDAEGHGTLPPTSSLVLGCGLPAGFSFCSERLFGLETGFTLPQKL